VKRILVSLCIVSSGWMSAAAAAPSRDEVLAAMKRAVTFMAEKVALRGGYVWPVSDDLRPRWGEIPARPSQIWVHAGTPMVGMTLLDAYDATGDRFYLEAARRAVDALVYGQHPLGGWHYLIDFDPKGTEAWYRERASQFTFGYEEYRHFYGNATYDDRTTSDAARFLLRFYMTTLEAAYRAPLRAALDFVLTSQYPNGAWPQRFPLRYDYSHDGYPDYTSYYTLNDGVMAGNVELLLEAHGALGDPRYFDAARRAVDFLIAVQGPAGQAGWAEQYGPDMRPIKARTHEPAGYVVRESLDAIQLLENFYLRTGDARYLKPIPACLDWFDRINREAVELKRPPARYWEPGTNLPVYVLRTNRKTPDEYGVTEWITSTPAPGSQCWSGPCDLGIKAILDVAPIRRAFEEIARQTTPEARLAYKPAGPPPAPLPRQAAPPDAATIIAALDSRGAWVSERAMVHPVIESGKNPGDLVPVRGISTRVFVNNLGRLIEYARAAK